MIIPMLKAPKTLAPPSVAHIMVVRGDSVQDSPYQKILRTALVKIRLDIIIPLVLEISIYLLMTVGFCLLVPQVYQRKDR